MAHTGILQVDQYFQLVIILVFIVTVFLLWNTPLCLPFKLLTVFLHEMSHAMAAWMCCSKVTSITVEKTEAGLTNYEYKRESVKFFVTPAGYIGSGVIGCCLIIACIFLILLISSAATALGALIASGILAAILLITIFFQKNWIPRVLTICVIIVVAVLYLLHFLGVDPGALGVRLVTLFIGVMNALYSVWDIYDDTVRRDEKGSDAVECALIMGCPDASRAVGVCWMTVSFILLIGAVAVHLYLLEPLHEEND